MLIRRASAVAVAALLLSGCTTTTGTSIDDIRERFVAAGGTCPTWSTVVDDRARDAILCSSGAKLFVFNSDAQRSDLVKTELESNTDIRARTHIMLSGEDWLIVDRIATIVKVMPSLHGIIQGRNGANP